MARKKGYSTVINQMARASARAEREKQQQEKTRIRELEAQRREVARREAQRSKEAKQQYLDDCLALTEAQNLGLQRQIGELETILQATLEVDDAISFQSLRRNKNYKQFQLPVELTAPLATPELDHYLSRVVKPTGLNKLVPGATKRYEDALKLAEEQYQDALKSLRTVHELFEADQPGHLEVVAFNGFIQTIDEAI